MADMASPYGTSRNPSEMGRFLSFIWKSSVDATFADLLAGVNGRKKVHELKQQKAKGMKKVHELVQQKAKCRPPPPLLLLNYKRRPGDFDGIIRDVQEIAKNGQEEAIQMNQIHERCVKSSKGTEPSEKMPREAYKELDHPASNRNRVFIRSRL